MAALYTQLVQQGKGTRSGFLMALLRRFDSAACLVTRGAAPDLMCVQEPSAEFAEPAHVALAAAHSRCGYASSESGSAGLSAVGRLLSTCAQLLAALPFRRADEPLAALVAINAIIAKRSDAVLAAFKAALKHTAEPAAAAEGGGTPDVTAVAAGSPMDVDVNGANGSCHHDGMLAAAGAGGSVAGSSAAGGSATAGDDGAALPADLAAACNASLAVSMLLLLKGFLLGAYGLVPERVAMFANASTDKKKQVRD